VLWHPDGFTISVVRERKCRAIIIVQRTVYSFNAKALREARLWSKPTTRDDNVAVPLPQRSFGRIDISDTHRGHCIRRTEPQQRLVEIVAEQVQNCAATAVAVREPVAPLRIPCAALQRA